MKKILVITLLTAAIYSCGPSAEEKAKMEQATADSLKAVEDMRLAAEAAAIAASQLDSNNAQIVADTIAK